MSEPYLLVVTTSEGEQIEMPLTGESFVIGRSSVADLSIPDRFMSRQHTRLFLIDGTYHVEDLGSHNGTLVNGKPVAEPTAVKAGDVLTISNTIITVRPAGSQGAGPGGAAPTSSSTLHSGHKIKKDATLFLQTVHAPQDDGTREELRRYADRLKLLNEVNAALAHSLSREELLEMILDRVFEHLQPEKAQILLRDEDGEYVSAAQRSTSSESGGFLVSRSLIREVVDERAAVLSVDASADERFASAQSILISGIKSILAAPLFEGDATYGLIALTGRLQVREFDEEDLELLVSLASVATMRLRNLSLLVEAAERRRLQEELNLARHIQEKLLPSNLPTFPGFDLLATNIPSRGVSGDYYGVYERDGECVLMLADVSGKGMAASLVSASLEALAAGPIEVGRPPEEICERCSRRLHARTPTEKYATCFVVVLELATGRVTYTNAGHNPALVLRAGGEVENLGSTGVPIGLLPGAKYKAAELTLEKGDLLVLYTDGITEAADPDDEEFGMERLADVCREHRAAELPELESEIGKALDAFAQGVAYLDDRTLLLLRRQP